MKGYKVFHNDWTCRGFKFEVGKIFEEDVKPKCCSKGFHFCKKLSDCFNYYRFDPKNKVAEVEAIGDIDSEDNNSKYCTNKIEIIKELTWGEVLNLVNTGKDCTGFLNSGDRNSGCWNSGDRNSGDRNSGDWNSGNWNSGDRNSGYWNSGDWNSGNQNSGNWNSGNYNSGNWNNGDWNSGDWNSGCFNTKTPKMLMFNKPSNWTYQKWMDSEARCILLDCQLHNLSWISSKDMSDEEKEKHPEHETTGGFLRESEEDSRQAWWDSLSRDEKDVILVLPNFDKEIFKEITGIDVNERL